MNRVFVLIHLAAVIVWIAACFSPISACGPVAAAQLPPPQRLPLLAAVLGRFFTLVGWALLLLWAAARPHLAGRRRDSGQLVCHGRNRCRDDGDLGVIVLRFHSRMVAAVAVQDWPAAGAAMNSIRQLVLVNLVLGVVTVAVADSRFLNAGRRVAARCGHCRYR